MFKTQDSSPIASPSYHEPEEFTKKAQSLLVKFETIQTSVENEKAQKFRKILGDLLTIQNLMTAESAAKKDKYNKMLARVAQVSSQIEQEKKKSERFRILLQGKIDSYKKMNDKAFDKLQADRLERQKNLQKFIEEKSQWLIKKNASSTIGKTLIDIDEYMEQLKEIKKETNKFFTDLEKQQNETKETIYQNLEEYRNMLNEETNQNFYDSTVQFMKEIHYEITSRVSKMAEKRNKMEQDTLSLLQQSFRSLSRGVTSKY